MWSANLPTALLVIRLPRVTNTYGRKCYTASPAAPVSLWGQSSGLTRCWKVFTTTHTLPKNLTSGIKCPSFHSMQPLKSSVEQITPNTRYLSKPPVILNKAHSDLHVSIHYTCSRPPAVQQCERGCVKIAFLLNKAICKPRHPGSCSWDLHQCLVGDPQLRQTRL